MKPRLAAAALALSVLCALQLLALLLAPARYLPAEITLRLAPGDSIALGSAELAAPRAAARQLAIRRDGAGHWWLRQLDPLQPVVLVRGGQGQRAASTALAAGQRLQLGASLLAVTAAGPGKVLLHDGQHAWAYDGAILRRDGAVLDACPDAGSGARLASAWNRIVPGALALRRPLLLGGHLVCGNRLAAPGVERGEALLERGPSGAIMLTVRGPQPVLVQEGPRWEDAARREHPLAGVEAIAIGRTRFALAQDDGVLRLRPARQVALYPEPKATLPAGVHWTWTGHALWGFPPSSPGACATGLVVFLLAAGAGLRLGTPLRGAAASARLLLGAALPAAATVLLAMQRGGLPPGPGWPLLLAWAALWHALLWPRRVSLLGLAAVLLLGAGLLLQLELGLGARDTSWLRHVTTTGILLGLGLPGCLLLCGEVARGTLARARAEWLLVALALAALAGLLLQVALGDETGVFEVQPVEFAKLALAALGAHCLALAGGGAHSAQGAVAAPRGWRDWLRLLAPVLLFVLLLAVALVQVDDYSPLVLLLAWAGASLLAWCLARGQHRQAALAGGLCVALLLGAGALQSAGPSLGAAGFYTERFQVWADPAAHPHTGQQMLLGARAVRAGGWFGSEGWLGAGALGGPAGEALAIPAVQDDFAPSFLIHRHGLAAALLLWCVQAALLAALLHAAATAWRAGAAAGDFRRAWLGRFQCFLLCGGAAFLGGHFLLSWGTNLALFPIMGQPMSFLSSGGSHLLFFICPLLAFGMASIQSFEENPSCRSMCNTKSWPR